jgi:hypothetical protein
VEKFNSRIWKHKKVHENAEVMKVNLDGRGFTKHGQHMTAMEKEFMAKRIVDTIKHILKVCKRDNNQHQMKRRSKQTQSRHRGS